ncbi:MAG: pseudouridine synthase [Clostridia bacterium]|nr:pseudouridine synthase [Clostridia bacterium]
MERLDKILSNSGLGTRKEVKKFIKYGAIKVDGKIATSADMKIDPENCEITVNGEKVIYKEFVYLMLNKPDGYVSATEDNVYPTVTELVPEEFIHYNLFPVGRLDVDTEGLLILTNDGKFAHNVTSPKKLIAKKYFVISEHPITEDDKKAFASGMNLGDFTAMPAKLENCKDGCYVTIFEGKFHQVKRMFEKINNKVTYLKRVQIGSLILDDKLNTGEMKELTKGEIEQIWI